MKKAILMFATVCVSLTGFAQEKYYVTAKEDMQKSPPDVDDAKMNLEKASNSPETKDKPKVLFLKAQVYLEMQREEKYKASNPYKEAAQTLIKLAEVKPDFEKKDVDAALLYCAFLYYNEGAKAYNDKKLSEATEIMKNVVRIHDLNEGKRFEKSDRKKGFDTVAADASLTMASSAYYGGKYEEAIPLLTAVKNNPITRTPSVYECLIDAYAKQNKTTESHAMIEEARKLFPDDVTIRNYELNYYIKSGKEDELVKKLEEAAAKDPQNADLQFNLATAYLDMANPKDGKKPANAAELTSKAEEFFKRAIAIAPDNAGFNYNFGALYYNQAGDVNDQMNAITGSSATDQKRYDDLKVKRDALFDKSMPYFEKSYVVLSTSTTPLKDEDRKTYKSTMLALKEIYARQNKMDKAAEMKKKYESGN